MLKEKKIYHKELAAGRWKQFSLVEQMGNIGSEVGRTFIYFKSNDKKNFIISFEKAIELFDLTLEDERWENKKEKIIKTKEMFCSLVSGTNLTEELDKKMNNLNKYFTRIGAIANEKRYKSMNK